MTPDGRVVHLGTPLGERTHDMKVQGQSRLLPRLPRGTRLWGDRGYMGLDKLCPQHEGMVPRMRPRDGRLSPDDHELSLQISRVWITLENVICKVKKFRICRNLHRDDAKHYGQFWGCVAGLVNLHNSPDSREREWGTARSPHIFLPRNWATILRSVPPDLHYGSCSSPAETGV